jgi:hypothetical protein
MRLALSFQPAERHGDDPDSAAPGEEPWDEILGDVGRVGLVNGSLNGTLHHNSFQWRDRGSRSGDDVAGAEHSKGDNGGDDAVEDDQPERRTPGELVVSASSERVQRAAG